jgi:hypothetical protein
VTVPDLATARSPQFSGKLRRIDAFGALPARQVIATDRDLSVRAETAASPTAPLQARRRALAKAGT